MITYPSRSGDREAEGFIAREMVINPLRAANAGPNGSSQRSGR